MKRSLRQGIFLAVLAAGLGMIVLLFFRKAVRQSETESHLSRQDLPYTIAMIVLDIAAPICLLFGLTMTTAANASLLNNFEIVATALIALIIFKEAISSRLWLGILFVTASCILLSFEDVSSFQFNAGSLFVLLACICWGLENNCTRKLSSKDPLQIVMVKGIFFGAGSVVIGLFRGERTVFLWTIPVVLLLGFIAYGLSIYFYVYAQRMLGAARTSAYYAIAPFIGVFLSFLLFRKRPNSLFIIALFLMIIGAWISSQDKPLLRRRKHNPL